MEEHSKLEKKATRFMEDTIAVWDESNVTLFKSSIVIGVSMILSSIIFGVCHIIAYK
jgi:hypothetical protein